MKVAIAAIGGLLVFSAPACMYQIGEERPIEVSAKGYDGRYEIKELEIRYHVPRGLIGPAIFTHANVQFHDASDLRVFVSSFRAGNGGIYLGFSPFPPRLATKRAPGDFAAYYEQHAEEQGLSATVRAEEISGIAWVRVEERYKNGQLARVVFIAPILSDYMLVCRIGLFDDLDREAKSVRWSEWTPAMAEVMNSIRIAKK